MVLFSTFYFSLEYSYESFSFLEAFLALKLFCHNLYVLLLFTHGSLIFKFMPDILVLVYYNDQNCFKYTRSAWIFLFLCFYFFLFRCAHVTKLLIYFLVYQHLFSNTISAPVRRNNRTIVFFDMAG